MRSVTDSVLTFFLIAIALISFFNPVLAERTVRDGLERAVELDEFPDRIIATMPNTVEIVLDLNLEEELVGVNALTGTLSYVPKLQKIAEEKAKVGKFNVARERVISLNPDLVVVDGGAQPDLVSELSKLGVPVYALKANDVEDVKEAVLELGYLTGRFQRAKEIVGGMEFKRIRLSELVDDLKERKRTLYAIDKTIYTTGGNTFLGKVMQMAGLENVFAELQGFKPVNDETIVEKNPQLIVIAANSGLNMETLKKRAGFKEIEALRQGQVITLDEELNSMISQPGTKILDGAMRLHRLVYGKDE